MGEDAWLEAAYEDRCSGYVDRSEDEEPDDDGELCEHGLSAWLCAGPMHYPPDPGQPGYGWY